MLSFVSDYFHFAVVIVLMMTGLYVVFASNNMIKKLVGLSVFQTSVFLLYITIGKVSGGIPPILPYPSYGGDGHDDHHGEGHGDAAAGAHDTGHAIDHGDVAAYGGQAAHDAAHAAADQAAYSAASSASDVLYSNPLPHVLILTAIVVGVATLAVGLALVVRIREVYGTIEEEEIDGINYAYNLEGTAPPSPEPGETAS